MSSTFSPAQRGEAEAPGAGARRVAHPGPEPSGRARRAAPRRARPRYTGTAQPVRSTCSASSTSTSSSPPSSRRSRASRRRAARGPRRRRTRRCRRTSVSPTPRSKIRARMLARPELAPERRVRAVGEDRRRARSPGRSPARSSASSSSRLVRRGSRTAGCRSRRAGRPRRARPPRAPRGRPRARPGSPSSAAPRGPCRPAGRRARDRRADLPRRGLDRERVGVRPAAAAQVEDRLAGAVARQLGLRAVGVEDPQPRDEAGLRRRRELEHAVGAGAEVAVAEPRAPASGVSSNGERVALDDQVVVAQGLPLLEAHGGHHASSRARSAACSSAATSSGARPVTSTGATPGSLRIQVSWRLA